METDERLELLQEAQGQLWENRLNAAHRSGHLYKWASSLHPDKLPCWLADHNLHYGSYNAGLKIKFCDGTAWLLRFPRAGKVHSDYADEKVAMEVAVINLIRHKTTVPVPKIEAWGVAAQNPLNLGPFIFMDFIQDGVSLGDLFKDPDDGTRLLREDISDDEMEIIYRQFAGFLLQLFKLDFTYIGNLDSPSPKLRFPIRPLTWKSHDILQTGGVDTFGDSNRKFVSTAEYFRHLIEQDWEQLVRQPNSVCGKYEAMAKYRTFKVLKSMVPEFVHDGYDSVKFKIICDDLGLANLMVRSREDLTVIGVVDLEWSYIGPAQLFGSAPWWLLMDRPTNQSWDCYDGGPTRITTRFLRHLDMFKRVLEEEEARTPGHENKELSDLVRWSERSGAMWLHMLLSTGFNDPSSFPFTKLVQHLGADEWKRREREVSTDEVKAFGVWKTLQLREYNRDLESIKAHKRLLDEGKMEKGEFVAMLSRFQSVQRTQLRGLKSPKSVQGGFV